MWKVRCQITSASLVSGPRRVVHLRVYQDILFAQTSVQRWTLENHISSRLDNVYSEIPTLSPINLKKTLIGPWGWLTRRSSHVISNGNYSKQNSIFRLLLLPGGELNVSSGPDVPDLHRPIDLESCFRARICLLLLRRVGGLKLRWALTELKQQQQTAVKRGLKPVKEKDIYQANGLKGQNYLRCQMILNHSGKMQCQLPVIKATLKEHKELSVFVYNTAIQHGNLCWMSDKFRPRAFYSSI